MYLTQATDKRVYIAQIKALLAVGYEFHPGLPFNASAEVFGNSYFAHEPMVAVSKGFVTARNAGNRESDAELVTLEEMILAKLNPPISEEIPLESGEYKVEVNEDGLVVGCQKISWKKFDEIAAAVKRVRK
jgi:hypothetical protein